MGQRLFSKIHTAQHAGHFLHPSFLIQPIDTGACTVALLFLAYKQMLMSLSGHLWQVGDGQYLAALAQLAQQLADNFSGGAADAHIHFVKYQCRYP